MRSINSSYSVRKLLVGIASVLSIVSVVNFTILYQLTRSQGFDEGDVINGEDTKSTSLPMEMVGDIVNNIIKAATESDAFSPVDSGQEGAYWPIIPDEHWNFMPRVYPPWNSTTHSWCGDEADYDNHTQAGLIYAKVHKAASSTLAGVTLRVAENYGRRRRPNRNTTNDNGENDDATASSSCATQYHHANSTDYHERDRTRSFMYSSIRHPASRAVSWVFYVKSGKQGPVREKQVLAALRAGYYFPPGGRTNEAQRKNRYHREAGAQVGFMHTGIRLKKPMWSAEDPTKLRDLPLAIARVAEVMSQYDLIMIVERLHESLVVFQLLLGLETSDILYLSAKQSGAYALSGPSTELVCHHIPKSFITPNIAAHLSSSAWYARNYEDYLLYKAANRSLDLTIDSLGRQRFEEALATYEKMMKEAKVCENEAITPCTSEGVYLNETDCYERDFGCGYPCLDRLFGKS